MSLRIDATAALQSSAGATPHEVIEPPPSQREPVPSDALVRPRSFPGARNVPAAASRFALAEPSPNQPLAPPVPPSGPLETTSAEYRLPAAVDPTVLEGRATEIWARVYRPSDLSGGPYPVVMMLHGNHATCGRGANPRIDDNTKYTNTGTCPAGYEVVPNHEGYGEAARELASHGYIVVSVNANRGITAGSGVTGDSGLNLARGRLLLRHLELLSGWNRNGGTPESLGVDLQGKLDLSNVGLMGHSRGGEGARAAYNLYRDADSPWPARIGSDLRIKGIFEIGPVDGQTSRVLDATGTSWNVLLPMCDGDVSNLQGVRPFDRMIDDATETPATPKSTFSVWGTNHNFYNSEWQRSDAASCRNHDAVWLRENGAALQRHVGNTAMAAFFRAHVGRDANPQLGRLFNPAHPLPTELATITPIERGYVDTPNAVVTRVFERFDRPTGTNTSGAANDAANVTVAHKRLSAHDKNQVGAELSWTQANAGVFFQSNWEAPGSGRDLGPAKTLTFRVARAPGAANPASVPTDFSIQLVQADGSLTAPVALSDYLWLQGPAIGPGGPHAILQTVRIPLAAFPGVDLTKLRGIRYTFDRSPAGAVYLSDLSLSTREASELVSAASPTAFVRPASVRPPRSIGASPVNSARIIRSQPIVDAAVSRPATEIEIESTTPFTPGGALYVLRIGDREYRESRYPDDGNLSRIIFRVDGAIGLRGERLEVTTDAGDGAPRWLIQ